MRRIKKKKAVQGFKVSALETYTSIAANSVTAFLYLQTTERAYDTIPLKAVFSPEIESAPDK